MPLCIAGMHRSGTSMVTRLLTLCGLQVGAEGDLLRPQPSNPEGFWENRRFIRVNDAVLRELGGTWDRPPQSILSDRENQAGLDRLKKDAVRLVRRFRGCEPWGWKDPRNCLTLPFWRQLLPDLPVLLCVRHPLAVARSLHVRDGMSVEEGLDLWLTYNCRVLTTVPAEARVVTHYDSYFENAPIALQRVLRRVGMEVPLDVMEGACGSIDPSLSHHRMTADEGTTECVSNEVLECYRALCSEAEGAAVPDGVLICPFQATPVA